MNITWDEDKREYTIHGLTQKVLSDIRVAILHYSQDKYLEDSIKGQYHDLWHKLVAETSLSHDKEQ